MNRLQTELRRLYLFDHPTGDGTNSEESGLISADGGVRAMVLELGRPADWTALSTIWRGVQADMELPAPAIAISGIDGYQLWFSLLTPVPAADASRFLELLRLRYLSHIAPGRIGIMPSFDASAVGYGRHARVVPALSSETGGWSAYVTPDLAAVFSDEPWLDVCPNPDAQADVLSRLVCINAADFQVLLVRLSSAAKPLQSQTASEIVEGVGRARYPQANGGASAGDSPDPKRFLLSVMGDKTIEMHLRIQAAQALLPYSESRPSSDP
ncbi:hypothetical protein [Rhodoferax sp.]|uniref:hypothetical protein n=1 Tax=Rhodoferax sp. TaxID=50421 RepID=UPI00374D8681